MRRAGIALALVAALGAATWSAPAATSETPPAKLVSGEPSHDAAKLDAVFAQFKLTRLSGKFSEEKHIALLARPLKSSGTVFFDRDRGISRMTVTPKPEHVVLTKTSLRITKNQKTETIPLDKSKDLRAFALVFPAMLRGDRAEIEHAFGIGLYGRTDDWWAVALTPSNESLGKLIKKVVVIGHKTRLVSLQVVEASGDTTDTQFTDIHENADVPDSEIATAFGSS